MQTIEKELPKSIYKNPERKEWKKNKIIKKVRFFEGYKTYFYNDLFFYFSISLIILPMLYIYYYFRYKLNKNDYTKYIIDYMPLLIIKIKLLIYNEQNNNQDI